jgi:hypothetical protein
MSSINRSVRHSVPMFLESIEGIKLGEREPNHVVEHRRGMAMSVVSFVVTGDQDNLDLGDIAASELAMATIQLCDRPHDQAAIEAFVSARLRFHEIQGSLDG